MNLTPDDVTRILARNMLRDIEAELERCDPHPDVWRHVLELDRRMCLDVLARLERPCGPSRPRRR